MQAWAAAACLITAMGIDRRMAFARSLRGTATRSSTTQAPAPAAVWHGVLTAFAFLPSPAGAGIDEGVGAGAAPGAGGARTGGTPASRPLQECMERRVLS